MGRVIGIDLGTTNSVVATLENGQPIVIPNREGSLLTPSVVAFTQNGRQLVGQIAKSQAVANPTRTVNSIKRRMGTYGPVKIDGQRYTPQEISSYILHKVKSDAECYLGDRAEKAVVTVPAYFDDNQRKATKDACLLAGLDVIRIINEPTAAALAYGLHRQDIHTVLVWDIGGGTFDVSILELGGGIFEVKAVNGNTQLGGDDWNQRIVDYLISTFQAEQIAALRQDEVVMQALNEVAEKAKIELSTSMSTVIILPFSVKGQDDTLLEIPLTRLEFEKLTLDLRQKLVVPTQQALQDAGLEPDDIDRVLLVGGSTRMPAVRQLVKELIGKEPYAHINPDEVVAIGAAIQAGILTGQIKDVVLVDVISLSLGIETQGGLFAKIIPRNTTIPCSRSQIFTTAADYQTTMDIHVLQGERSMSKDNVSLGKFELDGVSPAMRGESRVEVTFSINTNGIVQIDARDLYTDNERKIKISSPIRPSESEIEQAISEAQEFAVQDRKHKEMVQLRIRANNLLAVVNQLIQVHDKGLEESRLAEVRKAISDVESASAGGAYTGLRSAVEELEKLANEFL